MSFYCVSPCRFTCYGFVNDFTYDAVFITQCLVSNGYVLRPFCACTHISPIWQMTNWFNYGQLLIAVYCSYAWAHRQLPSAYLHELLYNINTFFVSVSVHSMLKYFDFAYFRQLEARLFFCVFDPAFLLLFFLLFLVFESFEHCAVCYVSYNYGLYGLDAQFLCIYYVWTQVQHVQ